MHLERHRKTVVGMLILFLLSFLMFSGVVGSQLERLSDYAVVIAECVDPSSPVLAIPPAMQGVAHGLWTVYVTILVSMGIFIFVSVALFLGIAFKLRQINRETMRNEY